MSTRTLALSAILFVGCSSSEDPPPATTDATTDVVVDTADTSPPPPDSDMPDADGSEVDPTDQGGTTGKSCKTSDDCDVTGDMINACSADWFAYGSLFPDPVCFGTTCTEAPAGKLASCDEGKGWCTGKGTNARCYPRCDFEADSETAPTGCLGKNACHWTGWTTDDKGVKHATGYCFGGCTQDSDCSGGLVCQKEWGDCVKPSKHWVAKKNIGDPCTSIDDGTSTKPPNCNCYRNNTVAKGYCTIFCKMGEVPSACPDGFTCDAELPTSGDGLVFTKAAKGLAGACYKNCTTDAECEPLGGFCDENAGTGRKTCQFGVRPGGSDAGVDSGAGDAASDASSSG